MKKIVSVAFLILAGLFFSGFVSTTIKTALFIYEAEATTGVVIGYDNIQKEPEGPPKYFAKIRYQRDGAPYIARNNQVSRTQDFKEGEVVSIYAVSGMPDRVMIRSLGEVAGSPLIAFFIALAFASFSSVLYRKDIASKKTDTLSVEPTKFEKSLLRIANIFRPSTLMLIFLFGPLLILVHSVIFIFERFVPSVRKQKKQKEHFVKTLEEFGFFKYIKNKDALPDFKEHIIRSNDLFPNNYRRINLALRSFEKACDEADRLEGWLRERGIMIDLDIRINEDEEISYKTGKHTRVPAGLHNCSTNEERLVVIARMFNDALAAAREPGMFYVEYPFTSSLVFLTKAIYQLISTSPVFPMHLIPLDVMNSSLLDVDEIAKQQEHPQAWHKDRLFKMRCEGIGEKDDESIRGTIELEIKKHNLCIRQLERINSHLYLVDCGSNSEANQSKGCVMLLLALSVDAYELYGDIADVGRLFEVDHTSGIIVPFGRKLTYDGKLLFSESFSAIYAYDTQNYIKRRILPFEDYRDYEELVLDPQGLSLLYSYTSEDDGLLRIGVHDVKRASTEEYESTELVEGEFSNLQWERAPDVFSLLEAKTGKRVMIELGSFFAGRNLAYSGQRKL